MAGLRRVREDVLAFALFLLWAVFITWPIARHPATQVPYNFGDPLENVWIFGWGAHAVASQPRALFHANIFFPSKFSLAFAENMLGLSIPVAPVFWLTHNAILTTNVGIILLYAVTGFGTFKLLLELTRGARWPSAFAAAAFAASPFRVAAVGHIHVVGVVLLPFVLLLLVRMHNRVTLLRAGLLAVCVAWQFWASLTGGLVTLVAVAGWGVWELAVGRRDALRPIGAALGAVVVGGILSAPVLLAYAHARDLNPGYTHPEEEAVSFSATPGSYAAPAMGGPVVRSAYADLREKFPPKTGLNEKVLFPGFVLSAAALASLAGAAVLFRRRREFGPGVLLGAVVGLGGFVMSLGPRWGAKVKGAKLPFAFLSEHVSNGLTRVPARFGTLVPFALAIIAASVLAAVPKPRRNVIAAVGLVLVLLEAWPAAFPMVKPPPVNAAHRWLAHHDGVVLALPTIEYLPTGAGDNHSIVREAMQMYFTTGNFRPTINGYGALVPAPYTQITSAVQDLPSDASIAAVHRFRIRYVVVENDLMEGSRFKGVSDRLKAWPGVRLVAHARHTDVFDVSGAVTTAP